MENRTTVKINIHYLDIPFKIKGMSFSLLRHLESLCSFSKTNGIILL